MATKPAKITKAQHIKWIRMLLTADSGFGKTIFGTSAPKTLLLLTDPEGSSSALSMGHGANFEEWVCDHANDLDEAVGWLSNGGAQEYEWLVVDNISHAQKLFRWKIKEDNIRRSPRTDPLVPEPGDYLRDQLSIEKLVRQVHQLPVNVLWTAWQEEHEDEISGERYYMPNIHGQKGALAAQVMGYMNINAFGKVVEKDGKEIRRMHFNSTDPYRGKDRFVALGKYQDNLTLPKMQSLVEEAKKGASSTATTTTRKKAPARRRTAAAK